MRPAILVMGALLAAAPASAESSFKSLMRALDARHGYEATLEMAWCKGEACEVISLPASVPLSRCANQGSDLALRWQVAHPDYADHELAWIRCETGERA